MDLDAEALVVLPPEQSHRQEDFSRNTEPPSDINNGRKQKFLVLEPAVFLIFFAMNLSGTVLQNQILYQSCRVVFNYTDTDCIPLMGVSKETQRSEEIETEVQPYVAKIFMARTLLESLVPSILSLFIGPWSDKFGRRPVIFATYIGYFLGFLSNILITFISLNYPINPWLYILSSVPIVLCGGVCALITGIYCYLSDVASVKSRALRMVFIEVAVYLGLMAGTFLSSYLYESTNVITVFSVTAIAQFLALLYIIFVVEESLSPEKISSESKIRGFFRWQLAVDVFKTCFEKRPNYDRAIIWLVMFCLGISIFIMEGDGTVMYLFIREKYEWTLKQYQLYNTASIICQIMFNIIGMYFLRKLLRFSVTSMAMLALASSVLDSVVKATSIYSWQLYLAIMMGAFRGIGGPMCRAIISHVTPASDLGKVFAFTTSLETLMPLGSAPLYTYVYSATIKNYPGAFNFISSGMYLLCYIFLAIVFGIQKSFSGSTYEAIGS